MNYDFFADKADKLKVLDFIFKDTDLQVYDLGSPYGQEICQYKTVAAISSKFDLEIDQFGTTFQLWTPRHGGEPILEKLNLIQNVVTDIRFVMRLMAGDLFNCILAD